MNAMPQTAPVSDMQGKYEDLLNKTKNGPVLLMAQSEPAAVLVSPEKWDNVAFELFRLRVHELARKIEAKNNAENSWVTHEELMARLEKSHGSELITAINEGIAADVAG